MYCCPTSYFSEGSPILPVFQNQSIPVIFASLLFFIWCIQPLSSSLSFGNNLDSVFRLIHMATVLSQALILSHLSYHHELLAGSLLMGILCITTQFTCCMLLSLAYQPPFTPNKTQNLWLRWKQFLLLLYVTSTPPSSSALSVPLLGNFSLRLCKSVYIHVLNTVLNIL